ncbi:MAG: hypothetical protein ABEH38_03265 [Flavobacteriales bacterium]
MRRSITYPILSSLFLFTLCAGPKETTSEREKSNGKSPISKEQRQAIKDSARKVEVPAAGSKKEKEREVGSGKKGKADSLLRATVKDYTHLDGCRFLLITDNGKKLNPLELDSAYRKDGLKVRVSYRKKEAMTTCMAGKNVEIIRIRRSN